MADPALPASASALVVGATDPDATVAFLSAFGLQQQADPVVVGPAEAEALYGLGRATSEVRLGTPGADRPGVCVVRCHDHGTLPAAFERRPRALDIYTSSMDDALEHLSFVGLSAGPVGTLAVGPVTMRQCLVAGPDGLAVVLVESSHRRSSLLDGEDGRLFSEGHSVVWCVESMDDEARLLGEAGLTKGMDLSFSEPEVSTYLALPRSPVPIRMTMLSDEAVHPLRLELLEFSEDAGETQRPEALCGGLWALRHQVDDPESAAAALVESGCTPTGSVDSVAAVSTPGGIRLQLAG